MARAAAALVALVCWAGIGIQFRATLGLGYSVPETAWVLVRYFTILSNLGAAIAFSAIALGRRLQPALIGGIVLAMMLVGVVYATLLRGLLELSGGALLADALLHKAAPLLVPLWWLAFAPKGRLEWRHAALWTLYPALYLAYALSRGGAEGKYAYPFLDIAALGWAEVAVNCFAIALLFVIAGLALVWLDRKLGAPRSAT
jgi:hypothetical protein